MVYYLKMLKGIVCVMMIFVATANCANILGVFPLNAKSHFAFNEALMRSLVLAGHRVTMVAPYPATQPLQNFTVIDSVVDRTEFDPDVSPLSVHDLKESFWLSVLRIAEQMLLKDCYDLVKIKEIKEILASREKLYDIMFVETMPAYQCFLPIAQKLNIPVIGTMSARYAIWADQAIGNDQNPAILPFLFSNGGTSMTMFQRFLNAINFLILELYARYVFSYPVREFYEQHYPEIGSTANKKVSVLFYNNHPSIMPRADVPNAVHVGGIHVKLAAMNPLPDNIKKFIDESEHGVILFTFGSITRSNVIGTRLRNTFRDVFAEIPQRVIWKFEENIEGLSENVLLSKWVPQKEILGHKKVVAFISHCGMAGTFEAIYAGKPMIMIPVFGDQQSTAGILNELEVGVCLDITGLTKDKLLNALNAVVNDKKYARKMSKLSQTIKDNPTPPEKSVAYWTEYVLRHDGALHLRTAAADMPLYQYLLLDVIGLAVVVVLSASFLVYYMWKHLAGMIFGNRRNKLAIKKKKEQ